MQQKISAEPQKIRHPTLAGMFYPGSAADLHADLASFFNATVTSETNPKGILVPHAGYTYSGKTAACSYAKIPAGFDGTFIILGPSHQGLPTSTSDLIWETPIGKAYPDTDFIRALDLPLCSDCAEQQENSIEVQIPFLTHRFPDAKIVPILIGDQSPAGAKRVAEAVCSAIEETGTRPKIIASCDCSHYVSKEKAQTDDLTTLASLRTLDTKAFYHALLKYQPTMCGYGCIAAMADICSYLGAHEARVLLYTTSGDVTRDYDEVVGYCSMEVL